MNHKMNDPYSDHQKSNNISLTFRSHSMKPNLNYIAITLDFIVNDRLMTPPTGEIKPT